MPRKRNKEGPFDPEEQGLTPEIIKANASLKKLRRGSFSAAELEQLRWDDPSMWISRTNSRRMTWPLTTWAMLEETHHRAYPSLKVIMTGFDEMKITEYVERDPHDEARYPALETWSDYTREVAECFLEKLKLHNSTIVGMIADRWGFPEDAKLQQCEEAQNDSDQEMSSLSDLSDEDMELDASNGETNTELGDYNLSAEHLSVDDDADDEDEDDGVDEIDNDADNQDADNQDADVDDAPQVYMEAQHQCTRDATEADDLLRLAQGALDDTNPAGSDTSETEFDEPQECIKQMGKQIATARTTIERLKQDINNQATAHAELQAEYERSEKHVQYLKRMLIQSGEVCDALDGRRAQLERENDFLRRVERNQQGNILSERRVTRLLTSLISCAKATLRCLLRGNLPVPEMRVAQGMLERIQARSALEHTYGLDQEMVRMVERLRILAPGDIYHGPR